MGGIVIQSGKPVHGKVSKIYHKNTKLFRNINNPFNATRYHSLIVKKNSIPKNFSITATIEDGTVMAIEHTKLPIFGGSISPRKYCYRFWASVIKKFSKFK